MPRLYAFLGSLTLLIGMWAPSRIPAAAAMGARKDPPPRSVPPALRISVPGDRAAFVVRPDGSASLTVRVTDAGGKPRRGTQVRFGAPPSVWPTGSFRGGTGPNRTSLTVRTAANGQARAHLIAGKKKGVFLIDAVVANTSVEALFAVSVTSSLHPRLSALAARRAMRRVVLHGQSDGTSLRLVGPVLVPSGSVVGPDVPRTDQRKALGVTLRQASWFFWIDDEPAALFAHPVRYATLGAAVATPGAASFKVIGGSWWPAVAWPGSRGIALIGGSDLQRSVQGSHALRATVRPMATPRGPPAADPRDECYIVMVGPGPGAGILYDDAKAWRKSFEGNGIQPVDEAPAADLDTFEQQLQKALNNPKCKRLWITISAHGYPHDGTTEGGFVLYPRSNESPPADAPLPDETVDWSTFADKLQNIANKRQIEFVVIAGPCDSGAATTVLDGYGLHGTVATSASADNPSHQDPADSTMTFMADARTYLEATQFNDPGGIADWVKKFGNPAIKGDNPESKAIIADNPRPYDETPMSAETGDQPSITVTRPADVPQDSAFMATVTIFSGSVADFGGKTTVTVVIPPGQTSVQVPVTVKTDGATAFQVDAHYGGGHYRATAGIQVGGSTLTATPSTVSVTSGSSTTVHLALAGAIAGKQLDTASYAATLTVTVADGSVVSAPATITVQHGVVVADLTINGTAVGNTTITIAGPNGKPSTTIKVEVAPGEKYYTFSGLNATFVDYITNASHTVQFSGYECVSTDYRNAYWHVTLVHDGQTDPSGLVYYWDFKQDTPPKHGRVTFTLKYQPGPPPTMVLTATTEGDVSPVELSPSQVPVQVINKCP